ncbi:hypothetical protein Hanom_Chr11g01015441 [Helianthus anomalus]
MHQGNSNTSNATTSNVCGISSDNVTSSANNALVAQTLKSVSEPYDRGIVMEDMAGASVSQAFVAAIIEEEDIIAEFESENIEELIVVVGFISEKMEMDKLNEVEESLREET